MGIKNRRRSAENLLYQVGLWLAWVDKCGDPSDVADTETAAKVAKVLKALTCLDMGRYDGLLELRYFNGETLESLAEAYDVSYQAVCAAKNKALDRLAVMLFGSSDELDML